MPKLCQLFADLTFVAGADFDFWFEFKRQHHNNNKKTNNRREVHKLCQKLPWHTLRKLWAGEYIHSNANWMANWRRKYAIDVH